MMEKSAQPGEEGGGCTIPTIAYEVVVYATAERADTLPLFLLYPMYSVYILGCTETVFKEKHGVWNPMPELTITSPHIDFKVDFITFTMGDPMPESTLNLCQRRLYPPVRDYEFSLCTLVTTDQNSGTRYTVGTVPRYLPLPGIPSRSPLTRRSVGLLLVVDFGGMVHTRTFSKNRSGPGTRKCRDSTLYELYHPWHYTVTVQKAKQKKKKSSFQN